MIRRRIKEMARILSGAKGGDQIAQARFKRLPIFDGSAQEKKVVAAIGEDRLV
jgi:hypothetical protein